MDAARLSARAAVAALEGRTDDAISGFREALARFRSVGEGFDVATTALDFVILVGADHPATREAAAEARAIFDRGRARPYLERLDAALSGGARSAATAVAQSGSTVSSVTATG